MTQQLNPRHWLAWSLMLLLALAACTGSGSEQAPTETNDETAVAATAVSSPPSAPTETAIAEPTETIEIITEDNRSPQLRSLTADWNTNWNRRIVDTSDILSGGPPRDGIPSIDDPQFVTTEAASDFLADNEPVIALEISDDARAYPLSIITWHEIVNDTVGGEPVVVTFCPLCNAALVFDSRVDGEVHEFGVSGLLRNSDLIMYDRTTETLWQQFTGEAIIGDLVGHTLDFLPSQIISFADFTAAYPDGQVLSQETGFDRPYGRNPYAGYDTYENSLSAGGNLVLFTGPEDDRLAPNDRVVTVSLPDVDIAYPLTILSEAGVINDEQAGQPLVVFHTAGTASALGAAVIAEAADVGATGVFDPTVDGQVLTFREEDETIVDEETGSTWNILGQAIDGQLAGTELTPIINANHFWFSWAAFKPDTIIYQN